MNAFSPAALSEVRSQFPALSRMHAGQPVIYLDGPGGTQVPTSVVEAMSRYLLECNANHGGQFASSIESDEVVDAASQAFADFCGCEDPEEIVFGPNMTTLTFSFSRAIARTWQEGDEIVVTRLDHDANVSPWVLAARDAGVKVNFVSFETENYLLDMEEMANAINERTRLVAVGCASNATGGINPVKEIAKLAHQVGAWVYLDAVHYGPHGLVDVRDWDCDFVAFSAYKFFGPHLGTVWSRREILEKLDAYKVRPSSNRIPGKWMTGTQSFESIAGGMAAIDYLADLGREPSESPSTDRRSRLKRAFSAITDYEREISRQFLRGCQEIEGLKVYGVTELARLDQRFPTFSITSETVSTPTLAKSLAERGIFVWSGNYYALEFTERLGLEPEGMVRLGFLHYNTQDEVSRTLQALHELVEN